MYQLNNIPPFTGQESSEEAEKWLGMFVLSTATLPESGCFRLLRSRFVVESPACKWLDCLDEKATTSWNIFERKFRHRWIATSEVEARRDFTDHILTEDMLFDDVTDHQVSHQRISVWADDHLRLGQSTGWPDQVLIDNTMRIVPIFMVAYLEVFIRVKRSSFDSLCGDVKAVKPWLLEYELIRRRLSYIRRRSIVDRSIGDISEKIDALMQSVAQGQDGSLAEAIPNIPDLTESRIYSMVDSTAESVTWEPCTPLTLADSASGTCIPSEQSTPTTSLFQLTDSHGDRASSRTSITSIEKAPSFASASQIKPPSHDLNGIPQEWRKPTCLKTRAEFITIAQQAIDFVENFEKSITVKKCHLRNFVSAIAIRDKLIDSRRYVNTKPLNESGTDAIYDDLMLTMSRVHRYYAYETSHFRSQPTKDWNDYVGSRDPIKNILKADKTVIRISSHDYHLHLSPSGAPSVVGGLFAPNAEKGEVLISSARTVMFMAISSYLGEFTGEKKYTDMAVLAASCIKMWMIDDTTNLIKDCLINAQTAQERSGSELSCHLTGIAIEGFIILAAVIQDEEWRNLAIKIATSAMLYDKWHSADGILTLLTDNAASEGTNDKTFKGLLNRGLMVAYERNKSNEAFCHMVRSYINVQFNALFELSRVRNAYGVDWRGPYAGPYAHAQIAAFDTLVAALCVNDV